MAEILETQIRALLSKTVASRRRQWRRGALELVLPLLLVAPLGLVRVLSGDTSVPVRTNVDRAVHLGDPFDTKYAARLCSGGAIFAIAPQDGLGRSFQRFLRSRFGRPMGWPRLVPFLSGDKIEDYVRAWDYGEKGRPFVCGALIFHNASSYTLRLNGTIAGNRGAVCGGVDTRRTMTGRAIDSRATAQDWYLCSGFLAMQKLTGEFLAIRKGWHLDLDAVPFPTPAAKSRTVLSAMRELIALSVVLFFAYVAGQVTAGIVSEREMKLLDAMLLLGLREEAWFAACVVSTVPLFALYGLEFSLALSSAVFSQSSVLLVAAFFALFGVSMGSMALSASAMFESSRMASIGTVVVVFTMSRLNIERFWAYFFPPMVLTQGLTHIIEFELADVGLRRSNLWDTMGFQVSVGGLMVFLVVDAALYLLLWACLQRAACRWHVTSGGPDVRPVSVTRRRALAEVGRIVQESLPVACLVEVKALRKEFAVGTHKVTAVRNLDLGMAESEILALLGHNGAGKSTTVSMLTGSLQPTRGSVCVCGFDATRESTAARRYLGLCPQYDVLFNDLSASEHLRLAADLRGVDTGGAKAAADLLDDVGLRGVQFSVEAAAALPAGRRRALNIALAFVGNPRFIVLDEPTSGMDPFVRRTMWELLKRHRAGRAICLSTHYMDEAEMLGDQVCILSRGTMQCHGSPDWLKARLGSGYLLTITLTDATQSARNVQEAASNVLELLKQTATEGTRSEIVITRLSVKEIVIRVPFSASGQFPFLLRALDDHKGSLSIASVAVSATTLEELFLRLADGVEQGPPNDPSSPRAAGFSSALSGDTPPLPVKKSDSSSHLTERKAAALEEIMGELAEASRPEAARSQQGAALLVKRWQSIQRNRRTLFCLCLLPTLFNVLGIASIATSFELDSPPLQLLETSRDFNPDLPLRLVVPFAAGPSGRKAGLAKKSSRDFLSGGQWEVLQSLRGNASLRRPATFRDWRRDLQVDLRLVLGQDFADGETDLRKYRDMQQKGAPEFVIRRVMEKDGVPGSTAERFFVGSAEGSAVTGRGSIGVRDRVQWSVDHAKKEAKVQLGVGSAMLRAEATARSEVLREELVSCAVGGPALAAQAEEALQSLEEGTQTMLKAMQEGGAPAAARRALLERVGVPTGDIDLLVSSASTEAIPPEHRRQLQRCADWQAFAVALLNSTHTWEASRYGGFYVESISAASRRARIAVFHNTSVFHSAPLFLGLLQRAANGRRIQVVNWPLPLSAYQRAAAFSSQGFSFFTMSLIGAAFMPASVAFDLAYELSTGVMRQQAVAGMTVEVYTCANFAVDVAMVAPPLLLQVLFVYMFKLAVYVDCLRLIAVLLMGYALAAVAQVYAVLPELRRPAQALNVVLVLNVVSGFFMALAVWVLSIPFLGSTANLIARCIEVVGRLFPAFNLANALLTIPNTALPGFSVVYGMDPLDWQVSGEALVALALNFVVYFAAALRRGSGQRSLTDTVSTVDCTGETSPTSPQEVKDEQELAEEAFQQARSTAGGVVLRQLAVAFHKARGRAADAKYSRAVGPLSLVVPGGNILAVLGVSGSGKSSTLAAVAGALPEGARACGQVLLHGLCMRGRAGELGFCPQGNELSCGLTVCEHIALFGRLRGFRGRALAAQVRRLIEVLDLELFQHTLSQNLSGGNQRKLHCACALVGTPKLVLLDEPSAGLDPVARRSLWRALFAKMKWSVAVVATKSVDEAEALCSKLAVLGSQGHLNAVGTASDLKGRYGCGHQLRVTLERPTMSEVYERVRSDPAAVTSFICRCAVELGGAISSQMELATFAASPPGHYDQMLLELSRASWVEGLAGIEVDTSRELLPEDSAEMRGELAARNHQILVDLRSLFPNVQCVEAVSLVHVYQLADKEGSTWTVADIFESIEARKIRLRIAEYSIMQASLEHVFNLLAVKDKQEAIQGRQEA